MKDNPFIPQNPASLETNSAEPTRVKLSRWQTLADFRTRSAHQRLQRPGRRISYAFLRNTTFGFAFFLQTVFQPLAGGTVPTNGVVKADFTLTIKNLPTPGK